MNALNFCYLEVSFKNIPPLKVNHNKLLATSDEIIRSLLQQKNDIDKDAKQSFPKSLSLFLPSRKIYCCFTNSTKHRKLGCSAVMSFCGMMRVEWPLDIKNLKNIFIEKSSFSYFNGKMKKTAEIFHLSWEMLLNGIKCKLREVLSRPFTT